MSAYVVNFFERVCDSTGHETRCMQGTIVVRNAPNSEAAAAEAKRRFAEEGGVHDWHLRAHELEIRSVGEGERLA